VVHIQYRSIREAIQEQLAVEKVEVAVEKVEVAEN
jgi:hypothetical protein